MMYLQMRLYDENFGEKFSSYRRIFAQISIWEIDREQEDVQVQKIYPMKDRKIKGRTKGRGWRQERGWRQGGRGWRRREGTATPPP